MERRVLGAEAGRPGEGEESLIGRTDFYPAHVKEGLNKIKDSTTVDFTEKSWKTDLALVVEGNKLYVSKAVLGFASPVFDRMFQSHFKERESDELDLPGKTVAEVTLFLRCFYPCSAVVMSKDIALKVLPLADEYQVMHLKQRCEETLTEYISKNCLAMEEIFRVLKVASLYFLEKCRNKCIAVASESHIKGVDEASRKVDLPAETLRDIYKNISEKLTLSNEKLKQSNKHLTGQIENYHSLQRFWSDGTSFEKSKVVGPLTEDLVWTGKTYLFSVDPGITRCTSGYDINICGRELKIKFEQECWPPDEETWDCFSGTVAIIWNNGPMEIECSIKVHIVVVCKNPNGKHIVVNELFNFGLGCQFRGIAVAQETSINDPDKMFKNEDGNILVEMHLLMSTPTLLDSVNTRRT